MKTVKNEVNALQLYFCPFGFLDVKAICEIGDSLWIYESELFEIIDNDRESMGYDHYENFDPVASVLEHVLQMARNKIEEVTGYDFINDYSGSGTGIYTYWNYMCSSYDYSEEAKSELSEKLSSYLSELMEDKWCQYFLTELEIRAG